jgi:hypothetical protein
MKRRPLLVAITAVLAVLVLWRWWGTWSPAPANEAPKAGQLHPEDFALRVSAADIASTAKRDLFAVRAPIVATPKQAAPPPLPLVPLAKTAEEIAVDAAREEFAQISVTGIVFRSGKALAYVVKGDNLYVVGIGDKIGERFTVENVAADFITVLDSGTEVGGRIALPAN